MDIFTQLGIILLITSIVALSFKRLKQPLIPAYVTAGLVIPIIAGVFNVTFSTETIWTMSEIGIAFLLFIVGLEIEIRQLKTVGLASSLGGSIISVIMFIAMFLVALILGITPAHAAYIGLIFAFSSTMVAIKLLSDKRELGTLHGRIALGRLLTEDVLAIVVITMLTPNNSNWFVFLFGSLFKILVIGFGSYIVAKYILPRIVKFAATNQKLLFLVAITVCFTTAIIVEWFGLSIAIGGFIAGVILANTPFNVEIISHVKPLRDFFAILFFVSLGMEIRPAMLFSVLLPMLTLLLVFYLLKPFVGFLVVRFFGYTQSTSFLSSIALSQISEFSLIIAFIGKSLGYINNEIFSLIIAIAVVTIVISSYLIKYDRKVFKTMRPMLDKIDIFKHREKALHYMPKEMSYDTLLVGYNRLGYHILKKLSNTGRNVLVVDFNPEVIQHLKNRKIQCLYGDIGDIEILERVKVSNLELAISTVPELYDNKLLIRYIRKRNHKAIIIATAQTVEDALELYDAGADYVIVPHLLGGEYVSLLLDDFTSDMRKLIDAKLNHIRELKQRKALSRKHHFKLPL